MDDFKNVIDDDSDVILKVNDQEFRVSKAVLTASSPVFAAMFRHDMLENRNNIVVIEDIEPSTVKDLLCFIYTGNVTYRGMNQARALFNAADKYALDTLKTECLNYMIMHMSVDDFFFVVSLVYDHQIEMMDAMIIFFEGNLDELLSLREWHLFLCERRDVAAVLMGVNE